MPNSIERRKVDIEGVKELNGFKVPLSGVYELLFPQELRVNVVAYTFWCQSCEGQKPFYFCETENRFLCPVCHDYCYNNDHPEFRLYYPIKKGKG